MGFEAGAAGGEFDSGVWAVSGVFGGGEAGGKEGKKTGTYSAAVAPGLRPSTA